MRVRNTTEKKKNYITQGQTEFKMQYGQRLYRSELLFESRKYISYIFKSLQQHIAKKKNNKINCKRREVYSRVTTL